MRLFLPWEEVAEEDVPLNAGFAASDEAEGGATVGCDVLRVMVRV